MSHCFKRTKPMEPYSTQYEDALKRAQLHEINTKTSLPKLLTTTFECIFRDYCPFISTIIITTSSLFSLNSVERSTFVSTGNFFFNVANEKVEYLNERRQNSWPLTRFILFRRIPFSRKAIKLKISHSSLQKKCRFLRQLNWREGCLASKMRGFSEKTLLDKEKPQINVVNKSL